MAASNLDSFDLSSVNLDGLINEDVMQTIFDISAYPLPLTDRIGTGSHSNEKFGWTMDRLADPITDNKVVDGSGDRADQSSTGIRVNTHSQTSTKTLSVSTRADKSNTIGFARALAYQLSERGKELRRDCEAAMLSNNPSVQDDGAAVAGQTAGLSAWIVGTDIFGNATNSANRGATGADGGWLDTPTDGLVAASTPGTTRALDETGIRNIAQSIYDLGGMPSLLMGNTTIIRNLSSYMFGTSAQIATLEGRTSADGGTAALTAKGSVNVFITDFGVTLEMVSNRIQNSVPIDTDNNSLYVLDTSCLAQSFLMGYQTVELAKTGLADTREIQVDWGLRVDTWEALGVFADIDDSLPVILAQP